MPSGFNRETAYYYSPGVCPMGYSAACSSYSTDSSAIKTIATCCPTGYTCFANRASDQIYGCTSYFSEDETLSINSVLFDTVTAASTTSYPVIYASTTITVTSGVDKVAAYGVIIESFGRSFLGIKYSFIFCIFINGITDRKWFSRYRIRNFVFE
ncbi:hypothetical protein EAE96_007462 [Botrytis aclada]|nr:hypothetical protein EAE96_007462 [Botrytis aclada]